MNVNDKASTTEDLPPMDTSLDYPDGVRQLHAHSIIGDEERAHLVGQWKDFIYDSGISNIDNSFNTVTLEREKEEPGHSGPPEGRDESDQTPHRVADPGFPGPPEFARRGESEEAPVDNKLNITSDEVFSRLDNSLYELGSEYLDKLDKLSSEHKTEYNNLFAKHNDSTYKLTSESINDLNLSEHYSVFNVIGS